MGHPRAGGEAEHESNRAHPAVFHGTLRAINCKTNTSVIPTVSLARGRHNPSMSTEESEGSAFGLRNTRCCGFLFGGGLEVVGNQMIAKALERFGRRIGVIQQRDILFGN